MADVPPGNATHAPVVKGQCFECHDPHSSSHRGLLVASETELCVSCHGVTGQEIEMAGFRHAPAEAGACLACHEAHHAPREHLLAQSEREMCGSCHSAVLEEATRPGNHAHSPLAEGRCLECHQPHSSDFAGLAKAEERELCASCHDASEASFEAAHLGLLEDSSSCLSCHTPHASAGRGLFWPNRHAPFSEKDCDECHTQGD